MSKICCISSGNASSIWLVPEAESRMLGYTHSWTAVMRARPIAQARKPRQ